MLKFTSYIRNTLYALLINSILLLGCNELPTYDKIVENEISKGVIKDTLLFNLKLGDTKNDFFGKCMRLNQKGLVVEGADGFVKYTLPTHKNDSLSPKITMLFYGIFDDKEKMNGLKLRFYYEGWSLWNKKLQSSQLFPIVKDSLSKWFPGNDFIKMVLEQSKKETLIKVDGNRQIIIEPVTDDKEVHVRIEDLRYLMK